MSLHQQIMNLRTPPTPVGMDFYMLGHKDARHAAAELALKADAEIERLRNALREIASADMTTKGFQMMAAAALEPVSG